MAMLWTLLALAVAAEPYEVGPRDVLTISVSGEEALSGDWAVRDDGRIAWGYVGEVEVRGLSAVELSDTLRVHLKDYILEPFVSVHVSEYRSQPVTVLGAVEKPGVYFLEGPTTVRGLLAQAGGQADGTRVSEVRVEHADGSAELASMEELFAGAKDVALRPFDTVMVPEGQFVFVGGEVAKPGAILFQEGLTVSQALTQAGGPSDTARLSGAYLLRNGARIPVNLRRILGGREADVAILPGDQLFLRESPI